MCRKYFNKLMHTARPLMDVQASTLKDGLRDRRRNIGIFPETDVCWLDMTHKSPVSTITMDPLELHCLGLARGAMLCLGTMAFSHWRHTPRHKRDALEILPVPFGGLHDEIQNNPDCRNNSMQIHA